MDMNIKLESEEPQMRKKKSLYLWEGSTLKFVFLIVKKIRDTFSRAGFGEVKLSRDKNNKRDKNMFRKGGRKYWRNVVSEWIVLYIF